MLQLQPSLNNQNCNSSTRSNFSISGILLPTPVLTIPNKLHVISVPFRRSCFQEFDSAMASDDENRKRKQHIKSVVRVRPLLPYEIDIANERSCVDISENSKSLVLTPSNNHPREFNFPCILAPECSQQAVFERSGVKDLLRAAMQGYAVTIMAYGQTGSGKTLEKRCKKLFFESKNALFRH